MHSNGITHGDLHTNNWFYDEETEKFYLIDWGMIKHEDVWCVFLLLLDIALVHKFSLSSIALMKIFFFPIFPNGISSDDRLQFRNYFKEMMNEIKDPDLLIASNDENKTHKAIAEALRFVKIIQAVPKCYFVDGEKTLLIDIKDEVLYRAEMIRDKRIELRKQTEDPDKADNEENERYQEHVDIVKGILKKTPLEELIKLFYDSCGWGALMDAILAELFTHKVEA
ncbi:MAG: phosphotransferase [Puniceicoccales bacterium]|jgi:hypothetical protein|nr:phosphotransferase [Puniceicoccales bacterium]